MRYLVQKEGFKDSARIFRTEQEALEDGKRFYPNTPYKVIPITDKEAQERLENYCKRLKKQGYFVTIESELAKHGLVVNAYQSTLTTN